MLHDKVFGVGFMAAAASMFGYSYMQKEKAFEELNQTFFRMKNEWEESKEKLIESLYSQEEKIKDMEEERKTREIKILKTEEKMKEMEQERKQERKQWEEDRLQLIRERETLSQRFLSAENDEDVNQTPIRKNVREEDRLQLIREKDATSQTFFSAEKDEELNQTIIKKNEREEDRLQLIGEKETLSQTLLSAEKDEELNQTIIKKKEREEDRLQLIGEKEMPHQTLLSAEKDEDVNQNVINENEREENRLQMIREKEAPSQTFFSAEKDEDVMNELKTTEKLVQKIEDMENIQENKTPVAKNEWEEEAEDKLLENVLEHLILIGEQSLSQRFLSAEQESEEVTNKMKTTGKEIQETEDMEDVQEEEMLQLIGEKQSLSRSFLSAQQESEDMTDNMKTTEEIQETEEMEDVQKCTYQFSDVCKLTMDVKTANRYLSLSENNRKVTRKVKPVREIQSYHSDSFDYWQQVMCIEGLTDHHYCVVEWRGKVSIAVTYKGIKRTGWHDDGLFGNNDKSWSLECTVERYTVCHNKKKTVLAVRPSGSNRVGMYLDWHAGILSFYRVSDTRTQLHTFLSTFTEPLYPGFWLGNDSYVSLLDRENDLQSACIQA